MRASSNLMRAPSALALLLIAACSTSSAPTDGGASALADAASGPQPVGAPCDPSLPKPCLAAGDDCLTVACDPVTLVCTEAIADGGPACNGGMAACTTSSDCEVGLTCGFPVGGGCAAIGVCLDPPILCEDDAAACLPAGGAGSLCGCAGAPVAIVVPGFAAGPTTGASSAGSCASDAAVTSDASSAGADAGP
jgi:hypothetical protein